MVVLNVPVNNCTPQTIVIGRRGTYDTMQIAFDLSYLVESYGNGVAVLAVKRSQDESAYPAVTSQEDDLLLWTISETDTYYVGSGECQLMWYVDGGLAKTIIYPMVVMRDILATSEETPDAYQEWVDALIAEGAETLQNAQDAAQSATDAEAAQTAAETAADRAEDALEEFTTPTASATSLSPEAQATAAYSSGHFTFGIPRGAQGATGATPDFEIGTVETLEPDQPATATITGTPENPVLNLGIPKGEKGEGGGAVESVNGKTGVVVLTASDVGAGTYSKPSGGIPKTDLAAAVQTSLGKADTALQTAPVSSVAGKTGAVTLDAGDAAFSDSETYAAGTVGAALSAQKNAIGAKAPVIINTTSGDVASFADGADGMQIRKIVGTIVTPEGGSGWTGANIYNKSVNLANPEDFVSGGIQAQTGNIGTNTSRVTTGFIPVEQGTTYIASIESGKKIVAWHIYNAAKESISESNFTANPMVILNSFIGGIVAYIRVVVGYINDANINVSDVTQLQIERGITPTPFKPFQTISSINWQDTAGTILNGTVTLNEDRSADIVNSDTSDIYHLTDVGSMYTYLGTNNVWIDTGAITECDYPADTKLFLTARDEEITGNIAPIENGMTASQEYAQGAYFWHDAKFCKALTAIASGATFTLNTNYTETTVAAELLAAQN